LQVLAFGRYQAGRSMPALMHLPTKVPSGICSASQTMISCVEVIKINTDMELKFRDWNHWRQALFPPGGRPALALRTSSVARPTLGHDCRRYPWAVREVARRTSYPGKVYGITKFDAALSPWRGRWFQHPGLNELADKDRERDLQHEPNDNQRGSHVYQRCP
jgi:hypothetical protein